MDSTVVGATSTKPVDQESTSNSNQKSPSSPNLKPNSNPEADADVPIMSRAESYRLLKEMTVASQGSEIWRKVPLEGLNPHQYDFAAAQNSQEIETKTETDSIELAATTSDSKPAHLRVVAPEDAVAVYSLGSASDLAADKWDEAISPDMRDFVRTQIAKQQQMATKEKDLFFLQNLLESPQQTLIVVKKSLDHPLLIRHRRTAGNSYMGRVYVYVVAEARCHLIEEFGKADAPNTGQDKTMLYYNTYTVVHCSKNTQVDYLCVRQYPEDTYFLQRFFMSLEERSTMKACYGHVGGLVGKTYVQVACNGRQANFRGLGAGVHVDREFHDFEVMVDNNASNVSSIIIYKMVLRDKAHSVFNGNLNIPSGFKRVRSLQTNHNILLDRTARAESMPRLIIASDDVSCDHGATVGQLSEDALFYLMSRGMTKEEAYYLMVEGFLNAIVEDFPGKALQQELMQIFRNKIGGHNAGKNSGKK